MMSLQLQQNWAPAAIEAAKGSDTMLVIGKKIRTKTAQIPDEPELSNLLKVLDGISANRNARAVEGDVWAYLNSPLAPALGLLQKHTEAALNMDEKTRGNLYGCLDPVFMVRQRDAGGRERYIDARKKQHVRADFVEDESDLITQRCRKCWMCNRAHAAEYAVVSEIDWMAQPEAYLLTRTFATDLQADWQAALAADDRYHGMMRKRAQRDGSLWRAFSAHEFGETGHRRHFHDCVHMRLEQLWRWLGRPQRFEDFKDPECEYWVCSKNGVWPWGVIHVAPVLDAKGAGYVGKYVSKSKTLLYDETAMVFRDTLRRRNEPILKRYVRFPRSPGLGKIGVPALVHAQKERLLEQRNWTMAEIRDAIRKRQPVGLSLPDYNDVIPALKQPRPAILRPQDRRKAADTFADITGESRQNIVLADIQPMQAMLYKELQRVAYERTATEWRT